MEWNRLLSFYNWSVGTQLLEIVTNDIALIGGDEVYLQIVMNSVSQTLTINSTGSSFELYAAPVSQEGSTIDLSANNNILPTEKQVDFISAICSRYNLIN